MHAYPYAGEDAEQMLCFLRWLDRDCDGYISDKDFSEMANQPAEIASAVVLVKRWEAAAVKG